MPDLNHPCDERLALLDRISLSTGAHDHIDPEAGECCLVEAASWLRCATEPSDHDPTVCPVIAGFARSWNDALPDEGRNRLLKPFVARIIGTNTSPADSETRAWMATDWLARVHTPAWLRLAGLTQEAAALEACARIVDATTANAAQPRLEEARRARAAAWAAAWDAARDAARAAAWAAAWDAAWDAARDAAWAAAWAAARDALRPTVEALQASAVGLLGAMCDVGRVPEVVDA